MNIAESKNYLKETTRSIVDYPKPGIVFRDLTTIFQDKQAMSLSLDLLSGYLLEANGKDLRFDKLAGIEARG